jgi:hypothetical protein
LLNPLQVGDHTAITLDRDHFGGGELHHGAPSPYCRLAIEVLTATDVRVA